MIRIALLLLALIAPLACEEDAPEPDGVSADEAAKILAEIKAKREAAAAAKAGNEKPAPAAKPEGDAAAKAADPVDAQKAKAAKLADDYQDKAVKAAKTAVAQAEQFRVRAKAEGGNAGGRGVYMHKLNLESGGTNGAVLDAAERVKEWLEKRDAARAAAGLPAIKALSVTDFIMKNGE